MTDLKLPYKVKKYSFDVYKNESTTQCYSIEIPALSEDHARQIVDMIYDKVFSTIYPIDYDSNRLVSVMMEPITIPPEPDYSGLEDWHIRNANDALKSDS